MVEKSRGGKCLSGNINPITVEPLRVIVDNLLQFATRYGDVNYIVSDWWSGIHLQLGLPSAILAAVSGTTAFSDINQNTLIAGLLALLVTVLVSINTFLKSKPENGDTQKNACRIQFTLAKMHINF